MPDDVSRELGEVGARLDEHQRRLDKIDGNLEKLLEYANRTKGGWLALAAAGTLGGTAVAAIGKMLATLKGG